MELLQVSRGPWDITSAGGASCIPSQRLTPRIGEIPFVGKKQPIIFLENTHMLKTWGRGVVFFLVGFFPCFFFFGGGQNGDFVT